MSDLVIKTATLADSDAVARLQFRSHTISFREFARLKWCESREIEDYVSEWAKHLGGASDDQRAFIARERGAIVGMVCIDGPGVGHGTLSEAHLHGMHAEPYSRGRGIGRALMEAAMGHVVARGYAAVILGCLESNMYARNFYERSGFKIARHFYEEPYGWTYTYRYEVTAL